MAMPIVIRFDAAREDAVLRQVNELGDRNNRTLGFLPYAGFRSAAHHDRIAVAQDSSGDVVAYCLFDLPRDVVRVVHLCVGESGRGQGLARELVDAVSQRHSDRLGLVLKCRADWDADTFWPKLGFSAQTQVAGRSKAKHPLTVWWRSHGHADLFSLLEEYRSTSRGAALDCNLYSDLHSAKRRNGSEHAALLAPFIADGTLNLILLPSLENEIYATRDAAEKKRFLDAKLNYTRAQVPSDPGIVEYILQGVPEPARRKDHSLGDDARLIAEAYANDIDLFITRDRGVIQNLAGYASELGVEVLHPTEVPTFLESENSFLSYRPAQLQETAYSIQRLDRGLKAEEISALHNRADGERLSSLRARLEELAGRSTTEIQRSALFDGDKELQAAWASGSDGHALTVPLLRVRDGGLQSTISAQLSQLLRYRANELGVRAIRVTDPHLPRSVRARLEGDGYYAGDDGLTALTLPILGSWDEISAAAQEAEQAHQPRALGRLLELPERPSDVQAAEFERRWVPVKILGCGIRNYLIPIRPAFASQLLGVPPSLMSRRDELGLSREHVYYRSSRSLPKPPARLLWYVSGRIEPSVVASSRLVENRVDAPRRLHRRYARLGVWDLCDVEQAASNGRAGALRFADTEIFARPVGLDRLRALVGNGRHLLLRSIQELDDESYERIYREGRR